MSFSCDVYDDPPDVFWERERVRARGQGKCRLCGGPIRKGQRYYQASGVWDGTWYSMVAHFECHELMLRAGELLCGEAAYVWDSDLDGASKELLALEASGVHGEEVREWMLRFGEVLDGWDGQRGAS